MKYLIRLKLHVWFDGLKEVKNFKEIIDLSSLKNAKYFKETKRSKSLLKAQAYLENPSEHLWWSFFVNIFNGLLFSQ